MKKSANSKKVATKEASKDSKNQPKKTAPRSELSEAQLEGVAGGVGRRLHTP